MPGCLTFALATSAASRALFECLYEELVSVRFLEKVCPESPIGAVSYIVDIQDLHGLGKRQDAHHTHTHKTDVRTQNSHTATATANTITTFPFAVFIQRR